MKKISYLFLFTILAIIAPSIAFAAMADNTYTCTDDSYNVAKIGYDYISGYKMRFYDTTNSDGSSAGATFCISPGRKSPHGNTYVCGRMINPTSTNADGVYFQAFDAAATVAYQLMVSQGLTNESTQSREVGELVFRWLSFNYGIGDTASFYGGGNHDVGLFMLSGDGQPLSNWDRSDSTVTTAIDIYDKAQVVGNAILNGTSWDDIVSGKTPLFLNNTQINIWAPTFTYTMTRQVDNSGTDTYNIALTASNNVPQEIYWDQFSVSCNTAAGYTCSVAQAIKNSDTTGTLVVKVTTAGATGSLNLEVLTAYYDIKDATANMMILHPLDNSKQHMIVVNPSSVAKAFHSSSTDHSPHGGGRVPVPTEDCVCDTSTGIFTYTVKDTNGKTTTTTCNPKTDSNQCKNFAGGHCPTTCTKAPHTCQTPTQSGDGKYYCKESSTGAGDGKQCDETEYTKECLCPDIKTKCDAGDSASCDDYNNKCIDCTPVITMPSTCNNMTDIDDLDTSNETGSIGDIKMSANTCDSSTDTNNVVKYCVLGKKDLSGNSFEATTELESNPYCKVWCKEDYSFNLPTAQHTTSGGYFTISAKISGTRSCYVSSATTATDPINETLFTQNYNDLQAKILSEWNSYQYWKARAAVTSTEVDSHASSSSASWTTTSGVFPNETTENHSCSGESKDGKVVSKSWTYQKTDANGNVTSINDSYSDGATAVCPSSCKDGSCTGSIGKNTDSDDKKSESDARNALISSLKELQTIINQYNSCSGTINTSELASGFTGISSFTSNGWTNQMNFEPVVNFTYNEDYMKQIQGQLYSSTSNQSSKDTYCSGDIDVHYTCQSGQTGSVATKDLKYIKCDEGGSCSVQQLKISSAKWVSKVKSETASFKPNNNFSTYTQYGTIKFKADECSGDDCIFTKMKSTDYPVSLFQKTGVFPFVLTFDKIGQYNSKDLETDGSPKMGRLIGEKTSILASYATKVSNGYKCLATKNASTTMVQSAGYVCHYLTNCPTCSFKCDDSNNCRFDTCDSGSCTVRCDNCIFDGESTNYTYRTVSLNNLFPNGYSYYNDTKTDSNVLDYNWSSTNKGKATQEEISKAGESIYDNAQYSYTLTATNLQNIRNYNKEAGSYSNNKLPGTYENAVSSDASVYCHNEVDKSDSGIKYPVKCKSGFLDLIEKSGNTFAQTSGNSTYVRNANGFTLYEDYDKDNKSQEQLKKKQTVGPAWK